MSNSIGGHSRSRKVRAQKILRSAGVPVMHRVVVEINVRQLPDHEPHFNSDPVHDRKSEATELFANWSI